MFFYFVTCPCSCQTKLHDNLFVYDDDDDDDDDIPVDGRRAYSFFNRESVLHALIENCSHRLTFVCEYSGAEFIRGYGGLSPP